MNSSLHEEIEELIERLKEEGNPIEGFAAYRLWELLSGNKIEMDKAREYYILAGYKPFSGYPLTRSK